jgi:hypothetical protein
MTRTQAALTSLLLVAVVAVACVCQGVMCPVEALCQLLCLALCCLQQPGPLMQFLPGRPCFHGTSAGRLHTNSHIYLLTYVHTYLLTHLLAYSRTYMAWVQPIKRLGASTAKKWNYSTANYSSINACYCACHCACHGQVCDSQVWLSAIIASQVRDVDCQGGSSTTLPGGKEWPTALLDLRLSGISKPPNMKQNLGSRCGLCAALHRAYAAVE